MSPRPAEPESAAPARQQSDSYELGDERSAGYVMLFIRPILLTLRENPHCDHSKKDVHEYPDTEECEQQAD